MLSKPIQNAWTLSSESVATWASSKFQVSAVPLVQWEVGALSMSAAIGASVDRVTLASVTTPVASVEVPILATRDVSSEPTALAV